MNKRGWSIFVVTQVIGVLAYLGTGVFEYSKLGLASWIVALATLFPGNLMGGWLIERLLWQTSIGLRTMSLVSTAVAVAINAVLWSLSFQGWKLLRKGTRANSAT